jgi:hypothetical protein
MRRLAIVLPGDTLVDSLATTRIHRVAHRTTLVTDGGDRSSLCSSIAMRTGNGRYGSAIRG